MADSLAMRLGQVNNPCEGKGCTEIIEIGLALRFCAPCRAAQPVPLKSKPRFQGRSK